MTNNKKAKILFSIFAVIVGLFTLIQAPFLLPIGLGAVLTSGILGGGAGKVGGAVMSKWKAINYIRAYAVPSNPNSDAQAAHRAKFKAVVQFAQKMMVLVIPQLWDPFYNMMSGFNALVKENFDLADANGLLDETAVLSKGNLEPVFDVAAVYTTGSGSTDITWDADCFSNGLATDLMLAVIWDTTDNSVVFQGALSAVTRTSEAKTVVGVAGKTATNLAVCVVAYRGTGEDYIQSNGVNALCTAP
jgi:hypothetical protein